MSGDLSSYLSLVTSEHNDKPKFMSTVTALVSPLVDAAAFATTLPGKFDFEVAAGQQLDFVGQWIGASRYLPVPLTDIYFALDDVERGLDFGSLQGPYDASTGLVSLPDDAYRNFLRAKIIANNWDGTIPSAYSAWDQLFVAQGFGIIIQNQAVMHILLGLVGPYPDQITLALFTNGLLSLKPAGVHIDSYQVNSVPYFALDSDTSPLGGLDHGGFGINVG